MKKKKLYNVMGEMDLFYFFDSRTGEIKPREANYLSFMTYPDGKVCLIANAFVLELYNKGKSRGHAGDPGGTILQYAKDISHIIRYCHLNKIDFYRMNDSRFTLFINGLRAERNEINPEARKRESNKLNDIGRKTLTFLDFVGNLNGNPDFVTDSIKAFKKTYNIAAENTKNGFIKSVSWHHKSFDTESPTKNRNAISEKKIDALYDAIPLIRSDNLDKLDKKLLDRRRNAMLKLLEITGARISELSMLTIADYEKALSQENPLLRLITLKRDDNQERFIPVLKQDLAVIKTYARITRLQIIKKTIGSENDHGRFFIGDDGRPLASKYMSNEVGLLRRAARISEDACAHMFRNRFITRLFVRLIQEYELENADDFRKALLDTDTFKQQVQQFTNHKRLSSLDNYIDWAFNEVCELDAVINVVTLRSVYEAFDKNVYRLHKELENGLPISEYLERYEELKKLRLVDVNRLDTIEQNSEEKIL